MHDTVPQTGKLLKAVVQGHFHYYAAPGNLDSGVGSALADRRVFVLRDSAHQATQEAQGLRRVTTNPAHIVRTALPAQLLQILESFRVEAGVFSFRLERIGNLSHPRIGVEANLTTATYLSAHGFSTLPNDERDNG